MDDNRNKLKLRSLQIQSTLRKYKGSVGRQQEQEFHPVDVHYKYPLLGSYYRNCCTRFPRNINDGKATAEDRGELNIVI